jgi:predicted RNase H-like nuclease (RuvC/YqgF family)
MNWGGPEFVLGIIAIATLGGIFKTWVRAHHGLSERESRHGRRGRREEAENAGEVERLKAENARLTDRLEASEDRLAVLERIVTDKSYNLASEIEALREEPARLQNKGNIQ